MEKISKVYYSDLRTVQGGSLIDKLKKLILTAGMKELEMDSKFVAIKIHFGEPGNLSYLRANYAKAVVDTVKELGGKPFLTDCNTLYPGRRKNALDHLDSAYENGFSPFSTGCHLIIADGLKGTDEAYVPVVNGELVKTAKIGQAIMDADIIISLTHFKGHEATGFGGALKNLGMGSGSRSGKMEQHCSGKPTVYSKACMSCGICMKHCAHGAISFVNKKAFINTEKCVGCGRCIGSCNFDAISNETSVANIDLCKKIAEYTQAVVHGRKQFHISLVIDISPFCDCHPENDVPIIPDVGMFASFDCVALDNACADACNKQPMMPNSYLSEQFENHAHKDHFCTSMPGTDWKDCLDHAEKIGVGTTNYELIFVK